jgi:3'-5' exoribonuclease
MSSTLPPVTDLTPGLRGLGFFLCTRKEERPTRSGTPFLILTLQDRTGRITAKVFEQADKHKEQFDEGDFVKIEGAVDVYDGRRELIVSKIRRVDADRDGNQGFREEDCVACAPRPLDEMWAELQDRIGAVQHPGIRALLARIAADHGERLRVWPAAMLVHHAYRGGLLEHVLQVARVADALAAIYGANRDLVFAGALLHDVGKLQEFEYHRATSYSLEGNLVGHIALGLMMVREAAAGLPALDARTRTEVEHLIASHHGSLELGSPVAPMSIEAMILASADDLDAKLHQVRRALAEDEGDGEFTGYQKRFGRVLLKPSGA